jgi:hypothetical protein
MGHTMNLFVELVIEDGQVFFFFNPDYRVTGCPPPAPWEEKSPWY